MTADASAPGRSGVTSAISLRAHTGDMIAILGVLLVVWLVIVVVGFVVKGLVWLAIIGIVLFLATAVYGWIKRKATGASTRTSA